MTEHALNCVREMLHHPIFACVAGDRQIGAREGIGIRGYYQYDLKENPMNTAKISNGSKGKKRPS